MAATKKSIYDILRGDFLIKGDAYKNWRIIIFVVLLLLVMIWSSHLIDEKVVRISNLNKKKRALRAEFHDTKTTLARMKLESSIRKRVKNEGLVSPKSPPQKIKLIIKE